SLELKKSKSTVAFIPVGATEQHGRHLPMGSDLIQAEIISEKIAAEFNAYLTPAMPFGTSIEQMQGIGSLTLSYKTLASVIKDLADSLARTGFKEIFVLSYHGGNFILPIAVRDINYRRSDVKVYYLNPWDLAVESINFENAAGPDFVSDVHSGPRETSLMLYIASDLVQMKNARDTNPKHRITDLNHIDMVSATEGVGSWGKATKAKKEIGKIIFEAMVNKSIERVRELLGG
ncbi:MAG: creatininase family protein, partial [bacterium]